MSSVHDPTRDITVHGDVSLSDFFARPIPIDVQSWTPGGSYIATSINPWSLYITNPRVSNRLSNYALFSGKLHVKFMVNGNSFYYGRMMVYYEPLHLTDGLAPTAGSTASKVQGSQKLKLFIDPCESQGGELELPFMWPYDMVSLPEGDYEQLGALSFVVLNELKHANGATQPISITTYAWMTDVKLSAPTHTDILGITPQADEYGTGIVSAPASALAGVAGSLSSVPIIGKYMRATSLAAGTMSSVARMFGFSRPTDVSNPVIMRHRNIGELAVTDVMDTVQKLTVDSKQELTIDPSVVGVSHGDEMMLNDIAARESYIATFNWLTSAISDNVLWSARVLPTHHITYAGTLGTAYVVPACAYAALPFKYWRGQMKYRFQIVASAYHKGRLKIVWDPHSATSAPESNIQYTKIVDLANERDFVVDIPWGNRTTWCEVDNLTNPYFDNGYAYGSQSLRIANGVINVYVLNELATPNSVVDNNIQVNVFVSMCNAEFAAPSDVIRTYSSAVTTGALGAMAAEGEVVPQSDVEKSEEPTNNAPQIVDSTESMVDCSMPFGPQSVVYMGETITSFRQMMKRYALEWVWAPVSATVTYSKVITSDFPMKYGYTNLGNQGTVPNLYDTANTTMMRYLAFAFLAYRGGVRRKYLLAGASNDTGSSVIAVKRNTANGGNAPLANTAFTTTSSNAFATQATSFWPSGLEGMAMTSVKMNQALEVELPLYRQARFLVTRRPYTGAYSPPVFVEDATHTLAWLHTPNSNAAIHSYVAAAEDSAFFCFQGCGAFYKAPTLV